MEVRSVLCRGTNLDGSPCTRHHSKGEETCPHHRPEAIEQRARRLEEQAAAVRASLVNQ